MKWLHCEIHITRRIIKIIQKWHENTTQTSLRLLQNGCTCDKEKKAIYLGHSMFKNTDTNDTFKYTFIPFWWVAWWMKIFLALDPIADIVLFWNGHLFARIMAWSWYLFIKLHHRGHRRIWIEHASQIARPYQNTLDAFCVSLTRPNILSIAMKVDSVNLFRRYKLNKRKSEMSLKMSWKISVSQFCSMNFF